MPTAIPHDPKTRRNVVPGYFKMRSRFVDYAGLYVLHCHILAHEDRGMMFSVNVGKPLTTVPSITEQAAGAG